MDSKILKAIADSLPETQVKIIKDALIERDELKAELKTAKEDLERYQKYYYEESAKTDKLEVKNQELEALVEKTTQSNLELMAKDIQNQVAVLQAELTGVNNTVDKFLKNTIYREELQHQVVDENRGSTMQYNNTGQQVPTPYVSKTNNEVLDRKERTTE
jgi:sRNA-binding carbon storage regulator CsrA